MLYPLPSGRTRVLGFSFKRTSADKESKKHKKKRPFLLGKDLCEFTGYTSLQKSLSSAPIQQKAQALWKQKWLKDMIWLAVSIL
jgi:hypothetical protein